MTVHTALLAFFGDDGDDGELDEVAALLETDTSSPAVERELKSLRDAINTAYGNVKDDLDAHQQVPVDAAPRRKAEAIERAVRASGRADAGGDAAAVIQAAASVREDESPDSAVARRFLDQIADERSSTRQLADVFETAARRLDEHKRAQSALDRLDAGSGVDSVPDLVDAYREMRREQAASASGRDRLSEAVESLLDELDVDAEGALEQRVRSATREIRMDSRSDSGTGEPLVEGVSRARSAANPRSRRARRLFDALEDGSDVEAALEAAAARLDEAATTDALLENVDSSDVADLAGEVAAEFGERDGTVADALQERALDLRDRVARADDSNRVVAFAAHEELSFYRQSLLGDALNGGESRSGESLDSRLEAVRERREAFEQDYVGARSDHNHSIPLYFLSLVDEAVEDAAESLAAGHDDRASGILDVAEQLIDHVEGLYEQNQYSVMLRSLRG
ncbi:hypothetical protein [Halobacterium salinarum]|uniref:Uncharacterized protein n=1 Tax=Halobacterium salinarum (strain ATCC 29341 / DSM 671 / R1) TaxID=478009 RepID=B0R9A2_HALS3|nr:hypothetical protein [Halobacterium salinarum]CAP15407.1 uncharacterized protein OE_6340R [Halobacterium salinarum R1]